MGNAARVPDLPCLVSSSRAVLTASRPARQDRKGEDSRYQGHADRGPRFLTTGGVYTADVEDEQLAGACHVHFVRSAVAHARIRSIDLSAALKAPGVIAAFPGADLAGLPVQAPPMPEVINTQMGQPLLARDVVRYVGEPVAVVVTEGRYQGEDAADQVDIDYDALPTVIDMAAAAAEGAPVLFPDVGHNVAASFGDAAALAADLFDDCEVVVSRTIANQRVAPAPMETRAAAAAWGPGGPRAARVPDTGARGARGGRPGRPADRVDPEPGRAGDARGPGGDARDRPGRAPDHHPGRGRRVRRQTRRGPGIRRGLLGRPPARPAGPVDREPQRKPDRDDSRPGAAPDHHHRRPRGWAGAGLPAGDPARLRCVPEVRRVPAGPDHLDGARPVRDPPRRGDRHVRGDEHHAGRRLPRRGPPRLPARAR